MAKGEQTFDSSKRKVTRYDNSPPTPGEYDFKLRSGKATVTVADGVGKVPYINGCQFELLDSASVEGGKNRTLFKSFFLRVDPAKDGVSAVDRGDGLTAFARSIGVALKGIPVLKKAAKDKDGKDVTALILDPKAVAAWLKAQDGARGSLKSKTRKDQNDPSKLYGDVDYFIEASEEEESEEDEDEVEESEDESDEDESDEDDEDEDEAEEDDDEEESDDEGEEDDDEEVEEDEEEPVKPTKKGKAKAKAGKKKGKK